MDQKPSGLRKNSVGTSESHWFTHLDKVSAAHRMLKRLSSKAATNEEARRTLRYVELLSDVRTPLADFSSILLACFWLGRAHGIFQ